MPELYRSNTQNKSYIRDFFMGQGVVHPKILA